MPWKALRAPAPRACERFQAPLCPIAICKVILGLMPVFDRATSWPAPAQRDRSHPAWARHARLAAAPRQDRRAGRAGHCRPRAASPTADPWAARAPQARGSARSERTPPPCRAPAAPQGCRLAPRLVTQGRSPRAAAACPRLCHIAAPRRHPCRQPCGSPPCSAGTRCARTRCHSPRCAHRCAIVCGNGHARLAARGLAHGSTRPRAAPLVAPHAPPPSPRRARRPAAHAAAHPAAAPAPARAAARGAPARARPGGARRRVQRGHDAARAIARIAAPLREPPASPHHCAASSRRPPPAACRCHPRCAHGCAATRDDRCAASAGRRACAPQAMRATCGGRSRVRGRGGLRLAAAVRDSFCEPRARAQAGRARAGAGSNEASRWGGRRPSAPDGGQGAASARRDRPRSSPSARSTASVTNPCVARRMRTRSAVDHCARLRAWRAVCLGPWAQIAPLAEYAAKRDLWRKSARAGELTPALERVYRFQHGYEGSDVLARRPRLDGVYAGSPAVNDAD